MQPVRRTVSQSGLPAQPLRVNSHIEFAPVMGRQGQSFRLLLPCGQSTGGLKTPGYSKTVLRTESAAAAPHPFQYLRFQWRGQLQMTAPSLRNMQRYGLAHCSTAARVNQAPAIPCTPRPHKYSLPMQSYPQDGLLMARGSQTHEPQTLVPMRHCSLCNGNHLHRYLCATRHRIKIANRCSPSVGRSLNSRGSLDPRFLAHKGKPV